MFVWRGQRGWLCLLFCGALPHAPQGSAAPLTPCLAGRALGFQADNSAAWTSANAGVFGSVREHGCRGLFSATGLDGCGGKGGEEGGEGKSGEEGGREKAERKGEGESGEEGGGKSGEEGGGLEAAGESDGDTDDGEVFLVDFADLDGGHGVVGGL